MKIRFVLAACVVLSLAGIIYFSRPQPKTKPGGTAQTTTQPGRLPVAPSPPPPSQGPGGTNVPGSHSTPIVNPYAGALRMPGTSKRAWDPDFIKQFQGVSSNTPIRFELTDGRRASGTIKSTQYRDGELTYISGDLTEPQKGTFFFLTPPPGGKAGKAVGVVQFSGSQTAYRIEPTGPDGEPELWQRRLDEVICQSMPLRDDSITNDAENIPPLRPDQVPDYVPYYNSNIVSLQSFPGSSAVLLLDFFGGYTPTWGGVTYPRPNVSNSQIKDVWKRVAEDYMPFNINVTTDLRVYQNAPAASRQRCVFTPSTSAVGSGAAGVAFIGSWNWGSDTVCWSIYTTGKSGAEVGAHEPGHTLGLGHQGTSTSGYFGGQGSGATGWAPIMGAGYYQPVTTWAKGEYQDANNHEDELTLITTKNNAVTYRTDDTGSLLSNSRYLEIYPGNAASAEGVIERTADSDAFQFTTTGGQVSLTASPVGDWADLALTATLLDSNGVVILNNNPQTVLSASISTYVSPGTYTFRVTGAGRNSPLTSGFSSYSSLGYYSITGSVVGARLPTRLSVPERSPSGTIVGIVPAIPRTDPLSYAIVSGNTSSTFSIDNSGVLRVAYNGLLDYSRLATNTMLPVRFELLVNITDLANPDLTELKRRVVVDVLNVNDPPVLAGFTTSVLEHTRIGTPIGSVLVRDPDFYETYSYSIVSGNSNGAFAIDNSGALSVAADLSAADQKTYTLGVAVSDNVPGNALSSTGLVTVNIVTNLSPFQAGSINYATYDNLSSGTAVTDLTGSARWPRDPTAELPMPSFEGLNNRADNYGAAIRGYLLPPQTANYTFWIATDDNGELWLSSTTNPATATRIAYISGGNWAAPRQWNKFSTQQSVPIALTAGQAYYIEARMKEGGGNDNIAVGWKGPPTGSYTNVIAGQYLAPYPMNYVPHISGITTTVHQGAFTGTSAGTFVLSDVNAADTHQFTLTGGTGIGLFTVDPDSGVVRVAEEAALAGAVPGNYTLQVSVTDSGSPPLTATASATLTVAAPDVIAATTPYREIWFNIGSGTAVSDLTNNAAFPRRPDKLEALDGFASAQDIAENYGSRIRAYLTPTTTGTYRFLIASDDSSTLFLSTDDTPAHAARIAYVSGATSFNQWTKYAQQVSAPITLNGGQRYYIEALQKEGGGGDHVEVAWTGPGIVDGSGLPSTNTIDGSFLAPFDLNYPPVFNNQTLRVIAGVPNGSPIGRIFASDSPLDTLSFKLIDGNTNNMFDLSPDGLLTILDNTLIADGTLTSIPLTVAVADSGYGGLFPTESTQAVVTVNVQPVGGPFVWTGAAATNGWSDLGNWGGAAPSGVPRLIFGNPSQQTNLNDTLSQAAWVQLTNGGFVLSGNPLRLQSGLTNSGNNNWGLDTTLAAPQTWQNSAGTLTVSGAISNGGFNFGLAANADLRVSGSIAGSGGLVKSGTARLLLSGRHTYSGITTINAAGGSTTALEVNGTDDLDIRNSDLTLNGRMDLWNHNAMVGALNGSGLIFANDLTEWLTVGANNHSGSFSGIIQNSTTGTGVTLGLVKVGSGSQTLSGINTFSGPAIVAEGTLVVASAPALGSVAGGTVVNAGATLALTGSLTIAEPVTLNGDGVGGTGALRNENGFVTCGGPVTLGSPATIRASAGRLTLSGLCNAGVYDLSFDTPAGASIVAANSLSGFGSLLKRGPGALSLNVANPFAGPVIIRDGTVSLGAAQALGGTSLIILSNAATLNVTGVTGGWVLSPGQVLQGFGTVYGDATLAGTVRPLGSLATLSLNGNAQLTGTVEMEIAKSGGVLTNDLLACTGTLTLGGTLTVTNLGPDPLALGDAFKIFDAVSFGLGSFVSFNLPSLPTGLRWDTSTLPIDGTLRVIPAAPPTLVVTLAPDLLTLSWPADYSSYILQAQTNPPGQGLDTNWYPVPGVTNTIVTIPLDTNNGSVFYRLSSP